MAIGGELLQKLPVFSQYLHSHRHEISFILKGSAIRAFLISYRTVIQQVMMFVIVTPYVYVDDAVSIGAYFSILSLLNTIRRTMFVFFSRVVIQTFEVRVGLTRIQVCGSVCNSDNNVCSYSGGVEI